MTPDHGLAMVAQKVAERRAQVRAFVEFHRAQIRCPIYASVDIRRNDHKAAVVDANAFPAGFNNLAPESLAEAGDAVRTYMASHYAGTRSVLVVGEGHTRNPGYFQNLLSITRILESAGLSATVGTLNPEVTAARDVAALDGRLLRLHPVERVGSRLAAGGTTPDLVVLNNDLSAGSPDILEGLDQPVTPPPCMGWHRRRKRDHFALAHQLADQVAEVLGIDPWRLVAEHEAVDPVDFKARQGIEEVARAVDAVLARVQKKYDAYGIDEKPHAFVKADPGTYGMGIVVVESGAALRSINSRDRDRMATGKGGVTTRSVLVQEGVPTTVRSGLDAPGAVAEPVAYLVCGRVVGGFNRVHDVKGVRENLNSPGARFVPFVLHGRAGAAGEGTAVLDEESSRVYRLVAELASLATGYEAQLPSGGRVADYRA